MKKFNWYYYLREKELELFSKLNKTKERKRKLNAVKRAWELYRNDTSRPSQRPPSLFVSLQMMEVLYSN